MLTLKTFQRALWALFLVSTAYSLAQANGITKEYVENRTIPVITFRGSDEDGTLLAWSLTGVDTSAFSVESGVVRFSKVPDYEVPSDSDSNNVYHVSVGVTDGIHSTRSDLTITVTNVEEKGTAHLSSSQPEVNTPFTATINDLDGGISHVTWVWESSLDKTNWDHIDGADSEIYTPVQDDIDRHLRVTLTYIDGEGPGKIARAISALVVRESHPTGHAPEFPNSETGIRNVAENSPSGTHVGIPIEGLDEGHVLTYTLSGDDATFFSVARSSGQLFTESPLDYEIKNRYSMLLKVSDPTNASDAINVTVLLTNLDEEGTVTLSTPQPYVDNHLVASLDDPDGEVSGVTWSWESSLDKSIWDLIDGADSDTYMPVGSDVGRYLRATVLSYTDAEGTGKNTQVVSLNPVQKLRHNHTPRFPATETGLRQVTMNVPVGTRVGAPCAAIDDQSHTLTYSLEGEDAGFFDIDETTGQLATRRLLDESRRTYRVIVTVHDGEDGHGEPDHSADGTLNVIIQITDVVFGGDSNGDGHPNPTDFNADGVTDFQDFFLFTHAFGTSSARFDLDRSGVVDFVDFLIFAKHFE